VTASSKKKPDIRLKMIIKAAREPWGTAWARLSEDQQRGALCEQVVAVLLAQDEEQAPEGSPLRRLQDLALEVLTSERMEGMTVLDARRIKAEGKQS
jgi:hypothetical protein